MKCGRTLPELAEISEPGIPLVDEHERELTRLGVPRRSRAA